MRDFTTETQRHRDFFKDQKKCRLVLNFLCVSVSLWLAIFQTSCSVPVLESPECIEARNTVKEFYSYHFDADMKPSAENLKQRQRFLSPELITRLSTLGETQKDYFTGTSDYPKAFRIGGCEAVSPQKRTVFGVLLFWKTDSREEQREIKVEAVKENDRWLIDKVENK